MLYRSVLLFTVSCATVMSSFALGETPTSWPQFRGRNSSGLALPEEKLPEEIGPDKNVVWKVPLPPGHSSPILHGKQIYVTAQEDKKLYTIGLRRRDGKELWRQEAPIGKIEEIHDIGSLAQPTPVTDGERVISFFGSFGLLCYDINGKLLWERPLGPFNNTFGAGTSPILADDRIILCQDHDTDSFLMALDKNTGNTLWVTDRSEFPRNYCTPVVWESGGQKQIVVAATLRAVGYDLASGNETWTVHGLSRAVCMTPVVGPKGILYIAGWAGGGDIGASVNVDLYETAVVNLDKNKNGSFEADEVPEGHPFHRRFVQVDRDKTGSITQQEYEYYKGLFDAARNVVLAVRPGGKDDITESHVLWQSRKLVPFCSSPLYMNGLLFTIKDKGILASREIRKGTIVKQGRVKASGSYYSSPIGGDGKVYLIDQRGRLTVISAQGQWEILSTADFNEDVYATPAIAASRIYLRTDGHLYCFATKA